MQTRILTVLFAVLLCVPAVLADDPAVEYTVHLDRAQTQVITIEMRLTGVDTDEVRVLLPVWRPGRYAILDPASDVRTLAAFDAAGERLAVRKEGKSTWIIATGGAGEVRIVYDLYANSLGDRTRHVDDTHAFLSGSAVFLLWPEHRGDEHLVRFESVPGGWAIASGLESAGDNALFAPDYDILVDSPIEIGVHDLLRFQVDGKTHEIAIWGEADYDAERMRRDFADIVREQTDIFGLMPYDRYVFIVHVRPGIGGGTEHYNSTVMQTRPTAFDTPDAYRGFLGLTAHEFFHTWNVKRFRPAGLSPYDYLEENYTPSLWLVEGTTSYYDDLTLARAGLIDIDEFLSRLRGSIQGYEAHPGRLVQSLEESSHDAWIKFSRAGPDRDNTTVNFYREGALASLVLDAEIRRLTGNRRSLDDVMKLLFERFPHGGPGYAAEDVVEIAGAVAGSDLDPLFASIVRGTGPLPLEEALAHFGVEMVREPSKTAWEKEDELDAAAQRPWLGINLAGGRVRSVVEGGPAFDAGINAEDEIIAIDGHRVSASNFDDVEKTLTIGAEAVITCFRHDRLREVTLTVAPHSNAGLKLRTNKDATSEQIEAFTAWLDQPWPEDDDESEDSDADAEDDDNSD